MSTKDCSSTTISDFLGVLDFFLPPDRPRPRLGDEPLVFLPRLEAYSIGSIDPSCSKKEDSSFLICIKSASSSFESSPLSSDSEDDFSLMTGEVGPGWDSGWDSGWGSRGDSGSRWGSRGDSGLFSGV